MGFDFIYFLLRYNENTLFERHHSESTIFETMDNFLTAVALGPKIISRTRIQGGGYIDRQQVRSTDRNYFSSI